MEEIARSANTSIRSRDEWHAVLHSGAEVEGITPHKARALASLEEHERAIVFGIIRPETVPLPPVHKQHVLDTCHAGWTPLAFRTAIEDWLELVKRLTPLPAETPSSG